jgi:uncharacterized protein
MTQPLVLSPAAARRLIISRQRLAGPRPPVDAVGLMQVLTDLRCLQMDPIRAVERTQLLVLWSRLGSFDPALLDSLLWEERQLFEYWAHAASIVLLADYPFFRPQMRAWDNGTSHGGHRLGRWVADNDNLRRSILAELAERGPLASDQLTDTTDRAWESTGWTYGRNVNRMLDYLWSSGQIMVAGRQGQKRLWDLSQRCLPDWTPRHELSWPETVYETVQLALRALGVARPDQIKRHFTRNAYPDLTETLGRLQRDDLVVQASIAGDGRILPGTWYVHTDDLPLVRAIEQDHWQPRTTLLSPFDNLICDRKRTLDFIHLVDKKGGQDKLISPTKEKSYAYLASRDYDSFDAFYASL